MSLIFTESPFFLTVVQFASMNKLQSLEITQDFEKNPLPNTLGLIPSADFKKISITSETISVTAVEDLLEQVHKLRAKSTYVTVKSKRVKGVRLSFYTNSSKIVKDEIRQYFISEFTEAD